jgi:capsular polysaccharide biosynthesis protein
MLELHPNIYGAKGRERVFQHLKRQGFVMDETTSRFEVASFKKPSRMKLTPDYTRIGRGDTPLSSYVISPQEALASKIISLDNAVLAKTPKSEGFRFAASVYDKDQNPVSETICWINHRQKATYPRPYPREKRIKHLPGTWIFGGRFNPHFGHFLTESISRLWALDHVDENVEGVLFFPTYNDHKEAASKYFGQMSEILDRDINFKICDEFYRVDKLIVPPQACGLGRLQVSSPEMRDFMTSHLRRDLEPTNVKKLYISRSGDFGKTGRSFLGELHLEGLLKKHGYSIFHPQNHTWADQMRHYQSATHILGPDGSPFHMVNFTGNPELKVGIIQRRPGHDANQMTAQSRAYGIEDAHNFSHLGRSWSRAGDRRAGLGIVSEVKFSDLCTELKALGFIDKKAKWANLSEAKIKKELQSQALAAQADQRPVNSQNDSLSQFPTCVNEGKPQAFLTS